MKITHMALALAAVAMLVAPTAMAGHYTLVRADRDAGGALGFMASVSEWNDDGSDSMPSGAVGAGLSERLTVPSGTPGDGASIVLDSRYVHAGVNSNFDPNFYGRAVFGDAPRIYPGIGSFMAWYGVWNDLDNDGVIDEYQRNLANPADEFSWHGAANGNQGINMLSWMHPSNSDVSCRPPVAPVNACRDDLNDEPPQAGLHTLGALDDPASQTPDFAYTDRTNGEAPGDEAWLSGNGWMSAFTDESFVMTTWVLTSANPNAAAGSATRYDIDPANPGNDQLRDIDRYESLSAEVEALYLAAAPAGRAAWTILGQTVLEPVQRNISELDDADEITGPVDDLIFPGRAFDGQTCAVCNFLEGWAPFLDLQTDVVRPLPNVVLPDGTNVGPWGFQGQGFSPFTAEGGDRSAVPGFLIGIAQLGWFFDANGDGWIGEGCPNEKNRTGACENPYEDGSQDDPNNYGAYMDQNPETPNTEFIPNCRPAASSIFYYEPVDTIWPPGTLLARQFNHIGGTVASGDGAPYELLTGTTKVGLRPDTNACTGAEPNAYTNDAIILPTGTLTFAIRASVTANFPAFKDASRGIDLPAYTITDVDVIVPPTL